MKRIISLIITIVMLLSTLGTAVFADEAATDLPFEDVVQDAWYVEGIKYCFDRGIVHGMSTNSFLPFLYVTRAQFVLMLAKLDGADLTEYADADSGFDDVSAKAWFNAAVCWAKEMGYVAGMSETQFAPQASITREQLARLLYVYGKSFEELGFDMSASDDLSAFEDADSVSDWALDGVKWCVAAGIISGMTETTIAPRETATRAQACRMIMCFDQNLVIEDPKNTSGAYRVIADYIKENGELGGGYWPDTYVYSNENFTAEYFPSVEQIVLYYCNGQYEDAIYVGSHANCIETLSILIDGLATDYEYSYNNNSMFKIDDEPAVDSNGILNIEGFTSHSFECERFVDGELVSTEEDVAKATERFNTATNEMSKFIEQLLNDCGLDAGEFFYVEITE